MKSTTLAIEGEVVYLALTQKILDRLKSTFFVVLGVMVFLGFVGGWILAYFALRPINNLIFSVDSVATGKMDTRVPISGNGDELDELAFRFNMMLGKIDTLLKAMKDCLDNVAHDLRTPVTRLRIIADRALTEPLSEQSQSKALTSCIKETMRIEVLLNMLLNISEAESGVMQINHQYIRVSELVENVVDAYRPVAEEKTITINVAGDTRLKCKLDPDRFCQILANILDNAIKYTPNDGQVSIAYYREKSYVIIKLQDTGIGISSTDLERIWERLYRGKQSRQQSGLGLGLSQAKAIAKAHMGDITVSSEPDIGSTFTISLHTPN